MKVSKRVLAGFAALVLCLSTPLAASWADEDGAQESAPSATVDETVAPEAPDATDKADDAEEAVDKTANSDTDITDAEATTQIATDTTEAAAQAAAEVEKAEEAAQAAPDETAAATEGDTTATDADAATGGEGETIYPLPSVTTSFDGPGKGSVTFVFQNPNENQQWFSAWLTPGAGVEVDCTAIDLTHQGSVCDTSVLRTAITVPGQSNGTLSVPLDLTGFGPWVVNVTTYDPWGETGVEGPLTIRSTPDQASSFTVTGGVENGQIVARFDLAQEYAASAYFNWSIAPQEGVTWVDCTEATHVYTCVASASGDVWVASGQPATVALVANATAGPVTVTGWVQRPGLDTQESWTFTVQVPEVTPPTTPPTTPTPESPTSPSSPPSEPSVPSSPAPTEPPSSPTSPDPTTPAPTESPATPDPSPDRDRHYYSGEEGGTAAESSADAAAGDEAEGSTPTPQGLPQTGGPGTGPAPAPSPAATVVTGLLLVGCACDLIFSLVARLKMRLR